MHEVREFAGVEKQRYALRRGMHLSENFREGGLHLPAWRYGPHLTKPFRFPFRVTKNNTKV